MNEKDTPLLSTTPLSIHVVSDFVCPWCFIGKRHLETALQAWGQPVSVEWLPYFLNPDTPPQGEPYRPFLEQKFGGSEAVERIQSQVREAGERADIHFAFEKITLRANTLPAHRLLHHIQQKNKPALTHALVEKIFHAGFCEGRFIGSLEVLADLAAECGEARDEIIAWLEGKAETAALIAEEARLRQLGISGVPFFIFNERLALSGAHPPEALLNAFRRAAIPEPSHTRGTHHDGNE